MEGLFLLLGLGLLSLPVMAIAAFARRRVTARFEDRSSEQRSDIRDLEGDVANLQRALADIKARLAAAERSSPPPASGSSEMPKAETVAPPSVAAMVREGGPAVPMPLEPSIPAPLSINREPAAVAVPPPVILPQAAKVHDEAHTAAPTQQPTAIGNSHDAAGRTAAAAPSQVVAAPPAAETPKPISAPQMPWAAASTSSATGPPPQVPLRPVRPQQFQPESQPPRQSLRAWLSEKLPLEEVLGMNLFAKIGIVLLVLGFALLGRVALTAMGPAGKVALLYATSGALLGGGIWLERNERYRLIGRTGIGGGWALAFFTTYAMNHVAAMRVMPSEVLNCALLLIVALAIVIHTLRYQSQLVTGLAFLLGFSTVALTQDTVYALSAGVILALGIVAVALRMGWFELEVFGMVASFGNHFYWLYRLYPDGVAGHPFLQFWPSTIILLLYWLVFRVSYVARRIRGPRDERISTVAALANTVLLLGVMKFQSTRPELAFYALAALGALEFAFGQLPVTRRRRAAFTLLTVLGTLLMFAAVPFHYSGNSIALVWMIGAEVLIAAGIVQSEVVFRRIGLIAGIVTGVLVGFEARTLIELRTHSEAPQIASGVQLLLCAALFYVNAHFIRTRWRSLFAGLDGTLATVESYLGAVIAFLGVWAVFPADWTAIGWAVLLLAATIGVRHLRENHFLPQAWILEGYFRSHPLPSERIAQVNAVITQDRLRTTLPLTPFHPAYKVTAAAT